jgi:hypothetical protein
MCFVIRPIAKLTSGGGHRRVFSDGGIKMSRGKMELHEIPVPIPLLE